VKFGVHYKKKSVENVTAKLGRGKRKRSQKINRKKRQKMECVQVNESALFYVVSIVV
jgi:hypothetical protein